MDILKLKKLLDEFGQPAFRLKQIQKAIYQEGVSNWGEITAIPKNLRDELKKEIKIFPFEVENILVSKDGDSSKALLKLSDGNYLETVLISPKPDEWSVCVSTQVGCSIGCGFCVTGKSGFKRNLTAEEIEGQVLYWMGENKISNIVFMGMGEPFLNWNNVHEAISNLHNPELFNFGWRSISVSTAGIPEGIEKMAQEFPQVNLAISLHFADNEKRSHFMPINKKYNLEELRQALKKYFSRCRRKVFIEYIMLSGLNDGPKDLQYLADYLESIGEKKLLHVNLISYNSISGEFQTSSREKMQEFKEKLLRKGINVTIRKSLGGEIQGACGQLAGKSF